MFVSAINFPPSHVAAAMSWPGRVGRLAPLSIFLDTAEDGVDYITAETPATSGEGFHIAPSSSGVTILWDSFRQSATAGDLIDAMQIIHPLPAGDLAAVREALARTT